MELLVTHVRKSRVPNFRRCLQICLFLFLLPSQLWAATQDERITLKVTNVSIKEFITALQANTRCDILYATKDLDEKVKITYHCTNKPLKDVLKEALKNTGLSFNIDSGIVTIFTKEGTLSGSSSSATIPIPSIQMKEIRGKVIDANTKEPLIGATVMVINTSIGAATNTDGNFILNVPVDEKELKVAFIGYKPQLVDIVGKTTCTVALEVDVHEVDEVVVTGVFTRKQNTYSGATNTIKSEELKKTGTLNVLQAIGTLDPSFKILVNDEVGSNPNAMPDIQMRGAASFSDMKNNYTSSPNQPLFIVDGFEQTLQKVLDMDMNRVASVTLLKDATAKAIYGSKGANGVVVIETKQPEQGKLRVSYSGDLNIQVPVLRDYNLTNAAEKLEVERLAGLYTNIYPETQLELDQKYQFLHKEVERGVNTDWLSQTTRVGVGHKHSLNIEGGDDAIRYNVNIGYNDVAGVMKGSSRKTFDGGFNLSYRYKNLLFREQFSITSNKAIESPYGSFADYAKLNPYWRVRDEQGRLTTLLDRYELQKAVDKDGDGVPDPENPVYNPMINAQSNYMNQKEYLDLTNNFYIDWSVYNDLRIIGRVSVTKTTGKSDLFYPSNYATLDPASPYNFRAVKQDAANDAYFKRGLYQKSNDEMFSVSSDITLNYSKQFGHHLIFTNLQYNVSQRKNTVNSYEGQGFADNATSISQARQYRENSNPTGKDDVTNEMGVIASLNYSYDSRYLLDANYRASASSLFGANNRWGHFWSVGAGWNAHYESFLKEVSWLDGLKIRASFGYSGSQNFSPYQAIATYAYFTDKVYDNTIGAYLMGLHNPDLKWQQTEDKNIGVDFSFLKKFDISFDYYIKTTSNLLTPIPVVPSNGFDNFTENLGKSENKGLELKLNYRVITDSRRDIYLSVFGNLSHNKNKLVEINSALATINDAIDKEQNDRTTGDGGAVNTFNRAKPRVEYAEGVSMSAIWGVRSLGIDPYNGTEILLDKNGKRTTSWNVEDKVVLGDALPKVEGSFGVNFDFKGITMNMNFSYSLGGQYYNQTLVDNVENADLQYNVDRRVFTDRWNPETPGVPAKYRQLKGGNIISNPTSRFVQDNNEMKLTSLNLGYDFRNCNWIKNSDIIERLQISMAMNDIWRLSTVKAERGISYPYAQSFICSIQATF